MTQYKVSELVNQREWNGQGNSTFIDYSLKFEGVDKLAVLTQKPETPSPVVGQTMDLDLVPYPDKDVERYPPKANWLKATKVQQGGFGGGGGPRPEDPKRSAAIQRMHSQEMAMQLVRLGLETATLKAPETSSDLFELIATCADWLDRDVQKVRDAA